MMIHIGGDWYVDADPLNISLFQKKIVEEGKNKGSEYFAPVSHYNTFQELLDGLERRKVRLTISESEALMQVNRGVSDIHRMIAEFCEKYGKEIEKKLRGESGDAGTEKEF